MHHSGYIIDIKSSIFYQGPIEKLKACIMMKKRCKKNKQHEENDLYVYSCSQRGISEQGCRSFHHIEKQDLQTVKDEVQKIKDETFEQEKKKLDYYR